MIFSDGRVNVVSWATDRAGGFSDPDLRLFEKVLPTYSTIVEVKSLRRFATNVLSTYVGREPGELIMKGQIRRGDVRTIKAALMMVDLRDFTSLSDALPPSAVIETLNRYFDCVIPPIKRHGGEVLEFLGDGILAILNESGQRSTREACQFAFEAAREGLDGLSALNHHSSITARHLKAGFALHYGEVSYGNIGAGDRLDFTVIGPDVNLTSSHRAALSRARSEPPHVRGFRPLSRLAYVGDRLLSPARVFTDATSFRVANRLTGQAGERCRHHRPQRLRWPNLAPGEMLNLPHDRDDIGRALVCAVNNFSYRHLARLIDLWVAECNATAPSSCAVR